MAIEVTISIGSSISASAQVGVESVSNGGTVTVLDQNDDVVTVVTAPGTYHVTVLDEINDEEPYSDIVIDDNS